MNSNKLNAIPRVLVADDDPVIRRWLTAILEGEGYAVVAMSDGRAVYRALQADSNFAAAVLDLSMPHIDGPDLIRYMRTEKRLMRIPVMMITAESQINVVASGLASGATVLLPKPFTKTRLQNTLGMMLGRKPEPVQTYLPTKTRTESGRLVSPSTELKPELIAFIDKLPGDGFASNQPVDLQLLKSLGDGEANEGAELIIELIDLYLDSAAHEVTAIKTAAHELNAGVIRKRAHSLKGSSATIGASGIAKLCDELDEAGHSRSPKRAHDLVKRLESEFASVRAVLLGERQGRLRAAVA